MTVREVVVLSAMRSAVGSFGGSLSAIEPADLGGVVMREAVARSGVDPTRIHYVTVGNCIPTESRYPYVARVAAIQAGLPLDSVAMAVNRLCTSGLQAIVSTAQAIMLGDCAYGIGGGVEVMSRSAYLSAAMRHGARMGNTTMVDALMAVLTDPFGVGHMGITAENLAQKWKISRAEQDALALMSQQRAARAIREGRFESQIVPVELSPRSGGGAFKVDEHCNPDTTLDSLAAMTPVFRKGGTVTAGNASGINDGAAFLVLAERGEAEAAGHKPMARMVAYGIAGVANDIMGEGPIPASRMALERAGLTAHDMDVVESNEAFSVQALAVMRALDLDPDKTNPNGGAVALGHPVSASGAIVATKALHELERIQGRYALVTLCAGGGQGLAVIFEQL